MSEEKKEIKLFKDLTCSTAQVFIRPLSKLQRTIASKGGEPKIKTFCALPPYKGKEVMWMYSDKEIWIDRPWLDQMNKDGLLDKAFKLAASGKNISQKERPLPDYDKSIKVPIYKMPVKLLEELGVDVYYEPVVKLIMEKLNQRNDGYRYELAETKNHDDPIPIAELTINAIPIED